MAALSVTLPLTVTFGRADEVVHAIPFLAHSGHYSPTDQCPLFGGKADISWTLPNVR
jgi:hypothetical protein